MEEASKLLENLYSIIYPSPEHSEEEEEKAEDLQNARGTRHHFEPSTFTVPTLCNYCKEFVWGFSQQGQLCSACGYVIHQRCIPRVSRTCRPRLVEKGESEEEVPKRLEHHWLEGNLPLGSICDQCGDSFELFGSNGIRCSRCETMVHLECSGEKGHSACSPRHKSLLHIGSKDETPLVVFVNTRSGGQTGGVLLKELIRLLDKRQVFDLTADGGPERGLQRYKNVANLRVLVCGGDGTVGWVLSVMDQMKFDPFPAVGVIPLGTGNDLARTLGWGTGYAGEDISHILDKVEESPIVHLDRWKVSFGDEEVKTMNNYLSIGVDAGIALEFHALRNAHPELFTSQFINKFWYAHYGFLSFFNDNTELAELIDLEVDGKKVRLPPGLGGVMVLNLPNYAGGANLWGTDIQDGFKSQSVDDKLLEVVAITGSFHMGTIQINLGEALRIAQGTQIQIQLRQKMPVQVDGEPWTQEPTKIDIQYYQQARMLYRSLELCSLRNCDDSHEDYVSVQGENERLRKENSQMRDRIATLERELRDAKDKINLLEEDEKKEQ